jgi:hypothetical protein
MHKVFSKSFAQATDAAFVTVVDSFVAVVVPEFTFRAVIPCRIFSAIDAGFGGWLRCLA